MKHCYLVRFAVITLFGAVGTVANATAIGSVDVITSSGIVEGWVADTSNTSQSIRVDFYIDQVDANHYAGHVLPIDQFDRPDVDRALGSPPANHGFNFSIPNHSPNNILVNFRANAVHHVYAYGVALNGSSTTISGNGSASPVLADRGALNQPIPNDGEFWFVPNQNAASVWYQPQPGTGVINGHIGDSFAHFEYWPNLRATLRRNVSGFGAGTAELGFMAGSTLQAFRAADLPVSVESPSFTQCVDGWALGSLDFQGVSPANTDLFCTTFKICSPTPGRNDPHNRGWFRTLEGLFYTPDEIVLDERMPANIPSYDSATINNASITNWTQRKADALRDSCVAANTFNSGVDRITGLINDYVEYKRSMNSYFAPQSPPRLAFHWVVHPAWEWNNPAWLDQLHSMYPGASAFTSAYWNIQSPLHLDTSVLNRLVQALCNDGTCPDTVYMDPELIYKSSYDLDVLRRNKAVLQAYGVKFGIDVHDPCGDQPGCTVNMSSDATRLYTITRTASYTPNELFEESMLNITTYLVRNGIADANTKLRFETYSRRPFETGAAVAEYNAHSYSYTVNRVFNEILIPWALAK